MRALTYAALIVPCVGFLTLSTRLGARCNAGLERSTCQVAVCRFRSALPRLQLSAVDSEDNEFSSARIVVSGQAKGGYFRAQARNEAFFNRSLCGALKELPDGTTEIIVEGRRKAIESFVRWCRKGPGLSQKIEDVGVTWQEPTGLFDQFEVFASR
ncbi:unnamed protein product [Phaeothamnion confervicola]